MNQKTQIQKQFQRYFDEAFEHPMKEDSSFIAAWKERRGIDRFHGLDELLEDLCREQEGALRLLEHLKTVMLELAWHRPEVSSKIPAQTVQWVSFMLLVIAERFVQEGAPANGGEELCVRLDRPTVAAIIGACLLDRGLYLLPDGNTGQLRAVNVLTDMPAIEYGFQSATDVARAELSAAIDVLAEGSAERRRKESLEQLALHGPRSHPALKMALGDLEREKGIRLTFAAPEGNVPPPLLDTTTREKLSELGVAVFFFGDDRATSAHIGDESVWQDLASDLMYYLESRALSPVLERSVTSKGRKPSRRAKTSERNHIFISYSHHERDTHWKDELLTHLHAFDASLLDVWVDTLIGAGKDWKREIHDAMARARVGVFMVSPSFLSSRFITKVEVPELIRRQSQEGMEIMPVLVRGCNWKRHAWLNAMQIRPGSTALNKLDDGEADDALASIADEIYQMCHPDE